MEQVLGYDCDGREIYEFRILRAIWSNDFDIDELGDSDPRQYCAVVAEDGNCYAISVYDFWNKDLIRKYEQIDSNEDIDVKIKPIIEMENYECAVDSEGNEFYYTFDRDELRNKLNKKLNLHNMILIKTRN